MLTLIFSLWFSLLAHPVHTSVTNISYDASKRTFEVSVRLFKHDLQSAIYKKTSYKINIETTANDSTRYYIKQYIAQHLYFQVKKKIFRRYALQSIRFTDDAVWVYLNLPFHKKTNEVMLTNSLLFDLFSNQSNLVIFSYKSSESGFRFTKGHSQQKISLLK